MSNYPMSIFAFEEAAKSRLPEAQWEWVVGAAEHGRTFQRNIEQFSEFGLRPAVLAGIVTPNLTSSWQGYEVGSPVVAAPIGHLTQFHESGELGVMEACRDTNTHCVVSMHTRRNLELLAQAAGAARWSYQVYLYSNPDVVARQIDRAVQLGAASIVVTVDNCHRSPSFGRQRLAWDARKLGQRDEVELPESRDDRVWTWSMLQQLIRELRIPIIVKGIQFALDAQRAKDAGARGIWLSNHGGRVNETDQSLLREIATVRAHVGPEIPLVVDGGFRTGSDIAKALLLGASHVALGRPLIYGLVNNGGLGAVDVLNIANRELALVLGGLGINDVRHAPEHSAQVFELPIVTTHRRD